MHDAIYIKFKKPGETKIRCYKSRQVLSSERTGVGAGERKGGF